MNSVTPPNSIRLITVPATAAIAIGPKAWTAKCRSTTSSAKIAPAIGALKLAETAPATAQPRRSRPVMPPALIRAETQVAITAARCTTGPSRPDEPPEPRVISEAAAEASPARISTRPPRSAAPSITSATARTRPSGVKRSRISPTTRPPRIGIASTHHHGKPPATEASCMSSVP